MDENKFALRYDAFLGRNKVMFSGAMGEVELTPKEVVEMLNGFNNTCIKLEAKLKESE